MTKNIFKLLILLIIFISCKTKKESKSEITETPIKEKIDKLGNRYLELNRFSGVILVSKEDSTIYKNNFGLADYEKNVSFSNNTTFKIGKISELITANIIRKMAKEKKFKLFDKISKYFPENNSNLTINKLDYTTSIKFIEKMSGKNFQENLEEYSKELGLENTNFQNINSTLAVGYLYHNYRGNGLELQKSTFPKSVETIKIQELNSTANDLAKIINSNSANKVEIDGYLENDGYSYSIMHNPKNKISIIVLSNRRHPVAKEISNSIVSILENKEYRIPLARKQFNINKELLKEYLGFYSLNEDMDLEVLNENDSLFLMMGPKKIHLVPQSENQFYIEQTDASIRFLRDSNNKVNEVELLDGFLNGNKFNRIEKKY